MELKAKKFLITQPMIGSFCGSTILTLELATHLQEKGAHVTVYTSYACEPMDLFFKKAHIKIVTEPEHPNFKLKDFDYIWVHSQILPYSILEDLSKKHNSYPFFIFLHMSSLKEEIPDETSWIYDLEKQLSSKSLYVGDKSLITNQKFLNQPKSRIGFYKNPAPDSFSHRISPCNKELKNILIVSNHPPIEIQEAKDILQKQGYNVVSFGENQENYTLITNQIISSFDAIITIGKTVNYCLVSGTPVYIYDRFGGDGWVLKKQIKQSGRGSAKKTSKEIVSEIVQDYQKALNFVTDNQSYFQEEFLLKNVLSRTLKNINKKDIKPIKKSYKEAAICAERLLQLRFILGELNNKEYRKNMSLIQILNSKEHEIMSLKQDLKAITSSKSFRIYKKIITPISTILKRIKSN